MLALTEEPDNFLMWAHYSQDHKGFVVEFDSDHKYFHQQFSPSDEFRYVRKVRYSDNRPNIRLRIFEDAADIFLTKSKEWEYEQELRIMRPLQDSIETIVVNGESVHLCSFPPDCITGIIFGCRMLSQLREEMVEYLTSDEQYSHVRKYDAVVDDKEFKLTIVPTEI